MKNMDQWKGVNWKCILYQPHKRQLSIMAEAEGRGCDLMDEANSPSGNSDDVKFKDPLLTGLDRDSDDDGVSG